MVYCLLLLKEDGLAKRAFQEVGYWQGVLSMLSRNGVRPFFQKAPVFDAARTPVLEAP